MSAPRQGLWAVADQGPSELHIDLVHADGEIVVRASGSLDWNTASEFDSTMREVSSRYDGGQIVVDLRDVIYLDLDGVDAVARAGYRSLSSGPMKLRPPSTRRQLLEGGDVAAAYTLEL